MSGGGSRASEREKTSRNGRITADRGGGNERERTGYGKRARVYSRWLGGEEGGLRGSRESRKNEYENLITTNAPPKRMTEKRIIYKNNIVSTT